MKIPNKFKVPFCLFSAFLFLTFCFPHSALAQKRNNLTDAEADLIRDAQELDARMDVFVKVIDRRLLAMTDANAAQSKQAQKQLDKWGELRTGTRAELLYDIQRTLEEAIDNIDDAAARDQKNPLFGKAVRVLANGCEKFSPQFKSLQLTDEKEKMLLSNSMDSCAQITEAAGRVPKEEKKEEKKKKN
jgi:acyl-CoA reductase-like NAD-dependent aldehyde dehydrogenase